MSTRALERKECQDDRSSPGKAPEIGTHDAQSRWDTRLLDVYAQPI